MYPRQVSAVGSQLFPDIGNGVDTDNVDTYVGEEQEVVHHLIEDPGIAVVQIPLVRVEGGHNIVADLREISEVTGSRRREYLRNSLLVLLGNPVIVKEEITAHILALSSSCADCPFVILGSMVHNEVHANADLLIVAGLGQILKIVHRAKFRLYLAEVGNGITAVRTAFGSLQKRHQMYIVDTALLQVIQLGFYAL